MSSENMFFYSAFCFKIIFFKIAGWLENESGIKMIRLAHSRDLS